MKYLASSQLESTLFAPRHIIGAEHVITNDTLHPAQAYHSILMMRPRVIEYLHQEFGLNASSLDSHNIGYVGASKLDVEGGVYADENILCGCITLPIPGSLNGQTVYGWRYAKCKPSTLFFPSLSYANAPIFAAGNVGRVAVLFTNPLYALGFAEMGYVNGVSALGAGITPMFMAALADRGVKTLAIFKSMGDSDKSSENENDLYEEILLAKQCGIRVCRVALPFQVSGIGTWDHHCWSTFDEALSKALKAAGANYARFQS